MGGFKLSLSLDHMDLCTVTDVLAILPALTKLNLTTCQAISDSPSAPSDVQGFPMLRRLCMHGCNMDGCLYVLKRMSPGTSLVYLELGVMGSRREHRWYELFNNLKTVISHNTLSIVHFTVYNPIVHEGARHVPMNFQTISPLLHFPHISEFKHTGYCYLDLNDSDVALMARAWPHLKSFIIRDAGRLTHHAFLPLAKYCPELEVLGMTIDATNVSDYEEGPERGAKLRELMIFQSSMDDSALVAAFISGIFPNVVEISFSFFKKTPDSAVPHDRAHWTKWKDVERLIPIFAAARRQEANRRS